ncbi:endoplasmic reticulum protein SC65-like [Myripristis murdjan]|uniref:Prolyl 3-hydroxylase family member 4 (inactive) n=1 Tax=Myripristis murdjan TaxID=586833 RepID=A0A667ZVQ6_9TELE|nr:endoplasmic reticulum protein SC65-like [Myripristis murdjan]
MVAFCGRGGLLLVALCSSLVFVAVAQYDKYNFRNFSEEELLPLAAAYGRALDLYAAQNWTEAVEHLELSLRLHRLLRDSVRYCVRHCNNTNYDGEPSFMENWELRVYWHVMMRASCMKKCREHLRALHLPFPTEEIMDEFRRRAPYKYLHFAHSSLNDLQKAVPCAYTYLQRNPHDEEMNQVMERYRSQYDLSGYLTDHEERAHEASFLKGVQLVSSGDYSSSTEHMEKALRLYLHEYEMCQAECEGTSPLSSGSDLYPALAEAYIDVLRCQLKCEDNLMPNVGGYFVEKFMATIYHYLQYAYYKLNNGRSAVPCAASYQLFEPEDQVMRQNLLYYQAYDQQWGLQPSHFTPRTEALKYHSQMVTQKQMLVFAEHFLKLDDEDFLGPEEAARLASDSPDIEFEGMGDYEESIYAKWWQPEGKGDDGESNA